MKELQLLGTYGLKNKKELWRILSQARADKKQARDLLISTNHQEFMTQGRSLLNRLYRNGMISLADFNDEESLRSGLREVLNFELTTYLDRRLQSVVYRAGMARNIHHARILIEHKHIAVGEREINKAGMAVRDENDALVQITPTSSLVSDRKGRYTKSLSSADPKEE